MSRSEDLPPFREALREAINPRDCLVLAAVPALLIGMFALPEGTRASLRFVYQEPSLVTAYTSHFVHLDTGHLLANLLGYVLLAGGGYVLAALAGRRRLFGVSAVAYLVAFPPVLSGLNLAVRRDAIGYGFSGVNMAFAGLLGLVLVAYGSRVDERIRLRHAPGVFFLGVALISLVALPHSSRTLLVTTAAILATGGYGFSAWNAWRRRARGYVDADVPAGWHDAGVLGSVAFLGYQFVGFPPPAGDGYVVNLYVHLLGFCLGFIVPYVASSLNLLSDEYDQGFLSG